MASEEQVVPNTGTVTESAPKHRTSPEMRHLENLLEFSSPVLEHQILDTVNHKGRDYPIYSLSLGTRRADVPVLLFVGGVHGVERIGAQVVLAFLETLIQRLQWDESLTHGLENIRVEFIPILNPVGLAEQTRSNGNGIDLMRNAPLDALDKAGFLVGGHRLSRRIPWYRGKHGAPMEVEAKTLCDRVDTLYDTAPLVISLDVHSGYGVYDRLWFPYAGSYEPVPNIADFYALKKLLRRTYPHLDYVFEPQSLHYITHGDLWDYLYRRARNAQRNLLPLTLEMGSWRWVKKNPIQIRSIDGFYNPVKPHRVQRVLRRHIVLMEFLIRAVRAYQSWLPVDDQKVFQHRAALRHWYEQYV